MTALDLGTASRVLTPPTSAFTSVPFGDVDLNVSGTVNPASWNGIPALTGSGSLVSATDFPVAQNAAIFVAMGNFTDIDGAWNPIHSDSSWSLGVQYNDLSWYSGGNASYGSGGTLPTAIVAGDLVVWCIVSNSTELRALNNIDGTLDVVAAAQAASPADTFTVKPKWGGKLLGIWQFEGVAVAETDAIDTMAAIVAALEASVPTAASATGGWGITAPTATVTVTPLSHPSATGGWGITAPTATVTVGTPANPPTAPTLDAGGAVTPPAAPTPATPAELEPYGIVPIRHVWERMPTPTLDEHGNPVGWEAEASGDTEFGTWQYVIEGEDVTVIDGIMTPEPQRTRSQPLGAKGLVFEFKQLSGFQAWPAWVKGGANVSIRIRKTNGDVISVWEGVLVAPSHSQPGSHPTLEAVGALMASNLQKRLPSPSTAPKDIGTYIPEVLNAMPSKRHNTIAKVVTGIRTSVTGGWEDVLDWVQRILATAVRGGQQWTLDCDERTPVMRVKDLDTVHFEVHYGQRNIITDLSLDYAGAPNVLYGNGVNPDGGSWGNWVFPGFHDSTTPPYPFTPPSQSIRVGTTDADTDTGDGVSRVQRKLGRPVTRTFNEGDRKETIRRQRAGGILDDGIVGPQTWAMLFQVGANSGTLAGAFPMPLAANPKVMPRLLGPDGDDLGPNPAYDDTILRVVDVIDSGQGVWKADAIDDAEERLAVFGKPAYAGTITFRGVSPEQMPRQLITEGMNALVHDVHGQDVQLHVAHVTNSPGSPSTPGTTVCQVDERGRDFPALQALLERDRSATDPAKLARQRILTGDITSARFQFDSESPAGRIEKHAVYGGLWTIARVPMGDWGTVPYMWLQTSASVTAFAWMAFGKQVTANQIAAKVGNPLTATKSPYQDASLKSDLGMLYAAGFGQQRLGYWPKDFSDPDGLTGAPITGRWEDDLSWEFSTENGQDLWVATFAWNSCFIEGRLYGRAG